ncbi:MAG: alpha/beta hydrolase-fold protein [Vulcanimicrobiota bacterium]
MNVDFTYIPAVPEEVSTVHLAGSFNDWNTQNTPMTYDKKSKAWKHSLDLPEGFYPYKFLLNGTEWIHDRKALRYEQNEVGSLNSVALVSYAPVRNATFSPLAPSYEDSITIYSDRPASIIWSLNGWTPHPRGFLKKTIPNLELNVMQMEKGPELYQITLGPFNKRKVPEVLVYSFVYEDGSVDDNFGKHYWIPLDLRISGKCSVKSFRSTILDRDKSFRIFVPEKKEPSQKFPLLLLLHGYGGNYLADWSQADVVKFFSDRCGFITVWPDGGVWAWGETVPSWYINSPRVPTGKMEDYLMGELIPYVESNYPCSGVRGIGGISMGGFGAFYLSAKHPDSFKAAASFSAIYSLYRYRRIDALRKLVGDEDCWKKNQFNVIKLISAARDTDFFFLIGDEERSGLRDNFNLKLAMDKAGIRNQFRIYPGSHTNNFWRVHLQEMMEFFAVHLGDISPY